MWKRKRSELKQFWKSPIGRRLNIEKFQWNLVKQNIKSILKLEPNNSEQQKSERNNIIDSPLCQVVSV